MTNQVKQGKFTKGPWKVELRERDIRWKYILAGGQRVACAIGANDKEETANAALIASAPMMYEALKALWEAREDGRAMYRSAQVDKLVLDALAQAEGGR